MSKWVWLVFPVAPLCWSSNFIIGRFLSEETAIDPVALSMARWSVASLLFIPWFLPQLWKKRAVIKAHFGVLFVTAVCGITLYNAMVYAGLHHTQAANASILNSSIPVFTLILALLFWKQTLHWMQLLGVVCSLLGVVAITTRLESSYQWGGFTGDFVIVAAAVVWALYSNLLRYRPEELSSLEFFAITMLMGWLVLSAIWGLSGAEPIPTGALNIVSYLYIGVFASIVAFITYAYCVRRIGAAAASQSIHLMPVFTTVASVGLLDEQLAYYHIVGAALVFGGVFMSSFVRS